MFSNLKDRAEDSEDLVHGQVVIIAARWILVVAGLVLAMWDPAEMGQLRTQIVLVLGLAVGNFFLHGQLLNKKPVLSRVVSAASAADIAVISLIMIVQDGFASNLYVFYFPALLAMSVAFRTEVAAIFTGAAIATYGFISLATLGDASGVTLFSRLLILAAVAFCGNVYWRIERDRRTTAAQMRDSVESGSQYSVPTE